LYRFKFRVMNKKCRYDNSQGGISGATFSMISFPFSGHFFAGPERDSGSPHVKNVGEKVPGAPNAQGTSKRQRHRYRNIKDRLKACHPLWRVRGSTECNTQPLKSLKRTCCSGRILPASISGPSLSSYSSKKEESSEDLTEIAIGAGKVLHHVDARQASADTRQESRRRETRVSPVI
jgi:hypothetical protein